MGVREFGWLCMWEVFVWDGGEVDGLFVWMGEFEEVEEFL